MCLEIYSKIKYQIYNYLGYKNIDKDIIDEDIIECLKLVIEDSQFKYTYKIFNERFDFLSNSAYEEYLKGSDTYILCATTLGSMVDSRINRLKKTDLLKCLIYDACASAYIEYLADNYEKNIDSRLSYRFCPGYEGTDVNDIRIIYNILNNKQLGLTLNEYNLIIPSKSMIGIVSYNNKKKTCNKCILSNDCKYKREGMVCYQ